MICKWIETEGISGVYGENIVDETRRILAETEANGTLPKITAPRGVPIAEIIQRTRPKPSPPGVEPLEEGSVPWYADWLARWTFFAFPDSSVRHSALDRALDIQIRCR